VEIVRRRGAVGDLHIIFGAHLQEAFETGRGVLRSLSFVTVRQQHDETRHAQPLAFTRRDELVDDHLGAVDEIAELVWCQEEPKNMGGWTFVEPWLELTLARLSIKAKRARYVGRPASASTAAGTMSRHLKELETFLNEAFA
jgi:2-oxoglutarate dehydrogenase complex dehydrogenase (E1) component-like enzyme